MDAGKVGGDRHGPAPDWGAREHLIVKWLGSVIGDDPRKVETFRQMYEKEVVGRLLGEIARESHTTEAVLSSRLYKLRQELIPKLARMDQEKPRRAILLVLFLLALGLVLAAVFWLLSLLAPPTAVPVTPVPRLEPPVTVQPPAPAPPPSFNQALPPELQAPQPADGKKP